MRVKTSRLLFETPNFALYVVIESDVGNIDFIEYTTSKQFLRIFEIFFSLLRSESVGK